MAYCIIEVGLLLFVVTLARLDGLVVYQYQPLGLIANRVSAGIPGYDNARTLSFRCYHFGRTSASAHRECCH